MTTHDSVLVFSKTWGTVYLFVVFVAAVIWAYWPSNKEKYQSAAQSPLTDEDKPCR